MKSLKKKRRIQILAAAAVALVLAITAELVIGSPGLGREIALAQSGGAISGMYALVLATGLIGGWLTARETGIRPIGGAFLGAAGLYAGRSWLANGGPLVTAGLSALYIGAFGASHPLAKKIGAWPSVLTVTALTSGAAHLLSDRK